MCPGYDGVLWKMMLENLKNKLRYLKGAQGQLALDIVDIDFEFWSDYDSYDTRRKALINECARCGGKEGFDNNRLDRFQDIYNAIHEVAPEAKVVFFSSRNWECPHADRYNYSGNVVGIGPLFGASGYTPVSLFSVQGNTNLISAPNGYARNYPVLAEFGISQLSLENTMPYIDFRTANRENISKHISRMIGELYKSDDVQGFNLYEYYLDGSWLDDTYWSYLYNHLKKLTDGLKAESSELSH